MSELRDLVPALNRIAVFSKSCPEKFEWCKVNGHPLLADFALLNARLPELLALIQKEQEDTCKLIKGFADNIEELAFRIPAPNEYTPQFVTYANAMRFIAQKRRELSGGPTPTQGEDG